MFRHHSFDLPFELPIRDQKKTRMEAQNGEYYYAAVNIHRSPHLLFRSGTRRVIQDLQPERSFFLDILRSTARLVEVELPNESQSRQCAIAAT